MFHPLKSSSTTSLVVVVGVLLCGLRDDVIGCSMPVGWRYRSPIEKLVDADHAIYGRVIEKTPTGRYENTVTVEVRCILKGERTPTVIELRNVGAIPGRCTSTDMDVDNDYVMLIWVSATATTSESIYHVFERFHVEDEAALVTFGYACGIQQMHPYGAEQETSDDQARCPIPAPPGECFDKAYFDQQYNDRRPFPPRPQK